MMSHRIFFSIITSAFAGLSMTFAPYAAAGQPASPPLAKREMRLISRAVFADDQLWMLHDDGTLVSLNPAEAQPKSMAAIGKVVDICKSDGHLLAVTATDSGQWTIRRQRSAGWDIMASIPGQGESLIALRCDPDGPAVALLTNRRLLEAGSEQVRSKALKPELKPPFAMGTVLINGDDIWIGLNNGEWGGGLKRISLDTGEVEAVDYNRSGSLCGGPLNTNCDPVNGIVASPDNPSCVIAAIGLVHMMSHGRIVEVCGSKVRRIYFKPLNSQPPHNELDDGEPRNTAGFFGLARSGNMIWALANDGLYRFEGSASPQFTALPTFENRGGYRVSFDVPGLVLVMTDVNGRNSLSGAVPIMAPR